MSLVINLQAIYTSPQNRRRDSRFTNTELLSKQQQQTHLTKKNSLVLAEARQTQQSWGPRPRARDAIPSGVTHGKEHVFCSLGQRTDGTQQDLPW